MKKLLIIATIAIVVFSCNSNIQEQSQKNSSIEETTLNQISQLTAYEDSLLNLLNYSDEFISKLNNNKNKFTPTNPRIPRGVAKTRIKFYKLYEALARAECGQSYNPKKDIYGFTFDISSLNDFMSQINLHNTDTATPKDS